MYVDIIPLKIIGGSLPKRLTYRVEGGHEKDFSIGSILKVPFGKNEIFGILIEKSVKIAPTIQPDKIRVISEVDKDSFALTTEQMAWGKWIAGYYHTDFSRILRLMVPAKVFSPKKASPSPPDTQVVFTPSALLPLGHEEEKALAAIRAILKDAKVKKTLLLHHAHDTPVTELYIHLMKDILKEGKQVIVLWPEIEQKQQEINRLQEIFGEQMVLLHSGLTDKKKHAAWWKIKSGQPLLIIGSRSALFSPADRLGLIIINEEHSASYKEQKAPYYHAVKVAAKRAELEDAGLILASSVPSAESYSLAVIEKKIHYLNLSRPAEQGLTPTISIVDLRDEWQMKNRSPLSIVLQRKIKERLASHEQVILFLNRRGQAGALICRHCGFHPICPRCALALTHHVGKETAGILLCHSCSYKEAPPIVCPKCQSPEFKAVGMGTQRIEQEVQRLFKEAKIVRVDRDATGKKGDFEDIMHDFLAQKYDILIGTQMMLKGLTFPKVTLVGILLPEITLNQPDFRSSEKTFRQVLQVASIAGRGEVVIQTYYPDHPALKMAQEYRVQDFMTEELQLRQAMGYPPFSRLMKCTLKGPDKEMLYRQIQAQREVLKKLSELNQLQLHISSAPAVVPLKRGLYTWHLFIRGQNPQTIFDYWQVPYGWKVEVDPLEM